MDSTAATAMPSESRQPVHADTGQLWPNLTTVPPPNALVVNVPLVDMGPENGSTEIWPGTHLDPTVTIQSGDIEVPLGRLEEQRAVRAPLQPKVRAGSVVIRDIRLWHAGMPNRTKIARPMIAMIHVVSWWPTGNVKFAKGSEPFLSHPDLHWNAEFADGEIDHISKVRGHLSESAV
jgi:ectoine hydroxylase-related dioxygenase (phytanoyl-CoA dioxygenase family)